MFHRNPKKNTHLINNNKYLLKQYKQHHLAEQPLFDPQGRIFTKLTSAQMLLLCLCIVACFPTVSARTVDDKRVINDVENQKPSDAVSSNAHNATASASPTLFYKGQPASNVTNRLSGCDGKPYGIERGKKCNLNGKTYYMKQYSDRALFYHGKYVVATNRMLLARFNLEFLKNNIGISVPNVEFFYEGDEIYYASQAVNGFAPIPLSTYFQGLHNIQEFLGFELIDESKLFTNAATQSMDSVTLSKFFVATTFIGDITRNTNNWGMNDKGELVILDMDISPTCISEYFAQVIDTFSRSPALLMSIDIVVEMKKIYQAMQLRSLPRIHDSVDMPEAVYATLLQAYITACDHTLTQSSVDHPDLDKKSMSRALNHLFLESIRDSNNKLTRRFFCTPS